jgi:lysophospholipase L1-like esterase
MKRLFLIILLLSASQLIYARKKIVDVILYGGQSNAAGQGYMKNIPEDFKTDTPYPDDKVHYNTVGMLELGRRYARAIQNNWQEFIQYNFEFKDKDAHIIMPDIPVNGNPWIWRARFPGWHFEMDSILLTEGFHVAWLNTNNQYGSPAVMKYWDDFYQYLTSNYELSEKVALEGVSRGGPAMVVPCTQGEQDLYGHHFPIETPRMAADFIRYFTQMPSERLDPSKYHTHRGDIRNSLIKFKRDKKGRVAFLGGSITYNGGWRDSICNYLQKRFPDTEFEFIPAGIPSMGTTPAAFRIERDVLSHGPVDLLFEEAAVNDASNGRTKKEQIRAMEGIVRHVRYDNPAADIVIMHFVDPDKMETYRSGRIPGVIQNHEKVADHYSVPTINLAKEVTERIDAKEFTWEDDFKNLHPSPFGQNIYFLSMREFLEKAWSGPVAADDKITSHIMPQPLDNDNYDKGILINPSEARLIKGWTMVKNWHPEDDKGTRANYVNVSMLIGDRPGSVLEFKFSGNAVGIAVAAGYDAGIIEYKIDNDEWKQQDLFTRWSRNLHIPWYYTLATGLSEQVHTLRIRIAEGKNLQSEGNACRIRYFFVNRVYPEGNFY